MYPRSLQRSGFYDRETWFTSWLPASARFTLGEGWDRNLARSLGCKLCTASVIYPWNIRGRVRGNHYYRKVWQIACNTPPEKSQKRLDPVYAPPTARTCQLFPLFPWNHHTSIVYITIPGNQLTNINKKRAHSNAPMIDRLQRSSFNLTRIFQFVGLFFDPANNKGRQW